MDLVQNLPIIRHQTEMYVYMNAYVYACKIMSTCMLITVCMCI